MHKITSFAAMLALCATARALDLTPQYVDMDADGLRIKLPSFQDGAKRVFIMPPAGWRIEGSSLRAFLSSDTAPGANVTFLLSPKPMLPKDEAGQKSVGAALLALAEKDSENVKLEAEQPDPLPINGWKTYLLRISYDIAGTRYAKSVMFVRLNDCEELQVFVSGPATQFTKATSAAMTCLRTWHKK